MSPRAHHGPSAIVLIDRDSTRRAPLAASLAALRADVDAFGDLDAALLSARFSAAQVLVLVALERPDGATIARLRARSPHASIFAIAIDDRARADSASAQHMKGRELLAMAQSTGCDGCLFYSAPHEIADTLGALWEVGGP